MQKRRSGGGGDRLTGHTRKGWPSRMLACTGVCIALGCSVEPGGQPTEESDDFATSTESEVASTSADADSDEESSCDEADTGCGSSESSDTQASTSEESNTSGETSSTEEGSSSMDDTSSQECDELPTLDTKWTSTFQKDLVAKLTGEEPTSGGDVLPDRQSTENRELARQELVAALKGIGLEAQHHDYGSGINVWARLPADAAQPSGETIVFGAHYDSVAQCPGANDNATGVAAILAATSAIAKFPCRTRDLIVVFFDEEESGLIGSAAFADELSDLAEHVHSVHTIDQMGWDENGDELVEVELPDGELFAVYERARKSSKSAAPLVQTTTSSTDHASFRPRYLAVGLTEGYVSGDTTPHYHKSTDTYDTINFAYLQAGTVLIVHAMADMMR